MTHSGMSISRRKTGCRIVNNNAISLRKAL